MSPELSTLKASLFAAGSRSNTENAGSSPLNTPVIRQNQHQQPTLRFDPVFKLWYAPEHTTPGFLRRVFHLFEDQPAD